MIQEQTFSTSSRKPKLRRRARSRRAAPRLFPALLIGLLVALILILIIAGLLLFTRGAAGNPFVMLPALLVQTPALLLVPLIGFLLFFIAALLLAKPLSLVAYLRHVHAAQEEYHKLYTPLTALANIRKAPDSYTSDASGPIVTVEEQQISILDLVQQQDAHQMILGVPGAGKTMALRVYQYLASQQPFACAMRRERVALYLPMKNYSLYLKNRLQIIPAELDDSTTLSSLGAGLLDFLYESDLPGMRYLRPYLLSLSQQGRLLLLCDGLNEVDSNYLGLVSEELVRLMRITRNRLVMTCREVDYREQHEFVQLVNEGEAARAVIYPLLPEQVHEFVERYVERQDNHWQHTAGQIMQVIDRSRLRYHCTNPMMLFTLMSIIDTIGVERGKQIDTRGRLLRESVKQLLLYERQQTRWSKEAPAEREVIRFLSEVACAARWANDRSAIQLRVSTPSSGRGRVNFEELADELRFWLDEHPAQGPFVDEEDSFDQQYDNLPQLLQFSLSAALIEVSPGGVLSFRHELIAEYFVAEYFFAATEKKPLAPRMIREELLEDVGRWSEPTAIWAGLLNNPLALAEQFGALGRSNPGYVLPALALALVCVGVLWTPPQSEVQRTVVLPPSVEEALSIAVRNRAAREELARIFTRCAEEGGQEVYRSLLPLIMIDGVDELLALLDQSVVPEILFAQLQDAVDDIAYEAQVKRLTRVLGRFGGVVVERAAQLSLPLPERSSRLRAAAINILGGTRHARAVEPLVARLSDADPFIVGRATNALIRLGPELTLTSMLHALENRAPGPFVQRVHQAALIVLGRFLDEQDIRRQLTLMQYLRVIETIVPVLTSNYQAEPEVQLLARQILVRQARNTEGAGARDNRWEKVIEALLRYLPTQNEVAAHNVVLAFQEIGSVATPILLEQLDQLSELIRIRVIEILRVAHNPQALPRLLRLMSDPSPAIQQQLVQTLREYAPESIPGLIDLVLSSAEDPIAEHAAQILESIGQQVVVPVINVLFQVVPGRTRLLVRVLEHIHDPQCVPALITLLQTPQLDPLLAIAVVHALGQFPDKRIVPPLLALLSESNPLLQEEAVTALSLLGPVALNDLVAAFDKPSEPVIIARVRRAILGMSPFPGEQLIELLTYSNEARAEQIMAVLKMQGADAAQIMVRHLLDKDERMRTYMYQALYEMPGSIVVPALLDVLDRPAWRRMVSTLLLKFPDAAIAPLVELLGENERGDATAAILPQFGPAILVPLIAGLDDQRTVARERAQRIIVALARQSDDTQEVVREIVHLFNPPPPPRAREVLLDVLTDELADVSIPALLEGLEDAYLIQDVAQAFVRLSQKASLREVILDSLINALYVEERRRGAITTLASIGTPAVPRVGELITEQNQLVARAAKDILINAGAAALPFIWNAHNDRSNPARRAAALDIFHSMRTEVIKDELIVLLLSDNSEDIAMAVALLLERSRDEATQHYADRLMVPELIDYVQTHGVEKTNLRIISLLLLLGEDAILDHLLQTLDDYPQHRRQLIYLLLLLGVETQEVALEVFNDSATSPELRAELAAVLGMVSAPDTIAQYAQNISAYGSSSGKTNALFPEQLAIALRALGGLLAGGHWNAHKLQELRDASKEGSPAHELFNVLLGMRYEPQFLRLQSELQKEQEEHRREVVALSTRIMANQQRIQSLEEELEQVRREHGFRGDELDQTRLELDQAEQESIDLRARLEQMAKEKDALRARLNLVTQEKQRLDAELKDALKENQTLSQENQQLTWQIKHPNAP